MKELSVEEKVKAYDEALKRAKDMLSYKEVRREDMEYLFPELKESENEKIRKAIVATIHLYYGESLEDEAKEMIAWIEKQEQKPTDEEMKTLLRIEYEKGRADAIAEMQNLAWSEEDEEFLRRAINVTKDAYPMTAKWLKSLKGRVQPKQEWSKEDESIALGIEQIVNCASLLNVAPDRLNKVRDWLKSLKQRIGG